MGLENAEFYFQNKHTQQNHCVRMNVDCTFIYGSYNDESKI